MRYVGGQVTALVAALLLVTGCQRTESPKSADQAVQQAPPAGTQDVPATPGSAAPNGTGQNDMNRQQPVQESVAATDYDAAIAKAEADHKAAIARCDAVAPAAQIACRDDADARLKYATADAESMRSVLK